MLFFILGILRRRGCHFFRFEGLLDHFCISIRLVIRFTKTYLFQVVKGIDLFGWLKKGTAHGVVINVGPNPVIRQIQYACFSGNSNVSRPISKHVPWIKNDSITRSARKVNKTHGRGGSRRINWTVDRRYGHRPSYPYGLCEAPLITRLQHYS